MATDTSLDYTAPAAPEAAPADPVPAETPLTDPNEKEADRGR